MESWRACISTVSVDSMIRSMGRSNGVSLAIVDVER